MSDEELLVKLFFGNINVDKFAFTKLMELAHKRIKVRLHFENDGVYADIENVDEYLLIYKGAYHLDMGGTHA